MKSNTLPILITIAGLLNLSRLSKATVTEVTVADGHTLSGVTQRVFKDTKKAHGHILSGECVQAPSGGNAAQIQVNNINEMSSLPGTYTFDIHVNSGATEGEYKLKFYDHTTPQKGTSPKKPRGLPTLLSVKVKKLVVVAVSFLNGDGKPVTLMIDKDTDQDTSAFEWIDGSKNQPGAFVRYNGGPLRRIAVRLHGPQNQTFNISAEGTWGGVKQRAVTFDNSGSAEETFEINDLPGFVTKEDVGWQWKWSQQNQSGDLNATGHKLYVTLRQPVATTNYEPLLNFTCGWAHGESTEVGTWDAIWSAIASRNATGYSYWPLPLDPRELAGDLPRQGYMPPTQRASWGGGITKNLLWYGIGRCGNWQSLMMDFGAIQGISVSAENFQATPPHVWFKTGAGAQGSGGGLPAQTQFPDHAIVSYKKPGEAAKFYDPSYGAGAYSDLLKYEDNCLSAYRDTTAYPGSAADWMPNVIGTQEIQ